MKCSDGQVLSVEKETPGMTGNEINIISENLRKHYDALKSKIDSDRKGKLEIKYDKEERAQNFPLDILEHIRVQKEK